MKPLTNQIKEEIDLRIKNKLDISSLIKDIDIKGADLSGAVINQLDRPNGDLSNTNFSGASIGTIGGICNFSNCKMVGCNFKDTKFIGRVILNKVNAQNSNFTNCEMPNATYQYADFTNCNFCNAVIRIGSRVGWGVKVSNTFFEELMKHWDTKFIIKEK